jgi:hypothetical protein
MVGRTSISGASTLVSMKTKRRFSVLLPAVLPLLRIEGKRSCMRTVAAHGRMLAGKYSIKLNGLP